MSRLALAAPLICVTCLASATEAQFGQWRVACTDELYCTATPLFPNVPADESAFTMARHARQSYWELSFLAPGLQPFSEITLLVDDVPFVFSHPTDALSFGGPDTVYLMHETAQALFDAMGPGHQLTVQFSASPNRPFSADISLEGLTASLLWIDEQQMRLGSERVAGVAPFGLFPVNLEAPQQVPASVGALHVNNAQCDLFEDVPHAHELKRVTLDDQNDLWLIPCFAGAYNAGFAAYVESREMGMTMFADLALFNDFFGWYGSSLLINPEWDPTARRLSIYEKGRGIGDCGGTGLWDWTGFGFRMLEYRYQGECNGEGGPDTWPIVYQAVTRD